MQRKIFTNHSWMHRIHLHFVSRKMQVKKYIQSNQLRQSSPTAFCSTSLDQRLPKGNEQKSLIKNIYMYHCIIFLVQINILAIGKIHLFANIFNRWRLHILVTGTSRRQTMVTNSKCRFKKTSPRLTGTNYPNLI